MPKFSDISKQRISTLHSKLQTLMYEVINYQDFSVICGYRGKEDQDKAVAEGKSKTPWPKSKHNHYPSLAVDIMPYYPKGIRWTDKEGLYFFIGRIQGIADMLGISIRLGIDWNGDYDMHNDSFVDGPHIELKIEK